MRKKKSERGRMWEVGEREERRWGGEAEKVVGRGGGKGGGCCVLAVAWERKRAAAKSVATARFPVTRYC